MYAWALRVVGTLCLAVFAAAAPAQETDERIRVGTKSFTESAILGQMIAQLAATTGARADVKSFAGSSIAFAALQAGEIDVYPEYTGTLKRELLSELNIVTEEQLQAALAARGLAISRPLGFNNTYAIGMSSQAARELDIERISDLAAHPELELAFSTEFMNRGDGWPGLRNRYNLPQRARGIEHALAYAALASETIDVTDLYSTDAQIAAMDLAILEDDLSYFPRYDAVLLYRIDLTEGAPGALEAMLRMEGALDASTMQALNRAAELGTDDAPRQPPESVAATAIRDLFSLTSEARSLTFSQRLLARTLEHLLLVSVSMAIALALALPLGVLTARSATLAGPVLAATGVLQTVPSLALLVLLIGPLGIGAPTAIVALILYSLLPIVRNTHAGLTEIPRDLIESADAIGLGNLERLRVVELPLARGTILAGIKTAAVINVGTATLGGFISAGGYGQPIFTGMTQNNTALILEGAIPAAIMAIVVQLLFDMLERWLTPAGLKK